MIETAAFIALILVDMLTKTSYAYPTTINLYVSLSICTIIFVNFFLTYFKSWNIKPLQRYSIMIASYLVLLASAVLSLMLFSGEVAGIAKHILVVVLYAIFCTMMLLTVRLCIKQSSNYCKAYLAFIIVKAVLIVLVLLLDAVIRPVNMQKHHWLVSIDLIIFAILSVVSLAIAGLKQYWYHRKLLIERMSLALKNNSYAVAVQGISSEAVLREIQYVLDYAPIRPLEFLCVMRTLYVLAIKLQLSNADAIKLTGDLSNIMTVKLMKRKFDFSMLPAFIRKPVSKMVYKKFKNNKRQN